MAKVFKTTAIKVKPPFASPPAMPNYTPEERNQFVENYWGGPNLIKDYFAIDLNKIEQLYAKSPTNQVALQVINIDNPEVMMGRWVSFDGNNEPNLAKIKKDDYYFVLDRVYYDGEFIFNPPSKKKGMKHRQPNNVICALIGTDNKGNYFAFFNIANIIIDDGGVGGNGYTGGAKIPTG